MGLWTVRKTLYKLGVAGLYIGFLLYMVGFSTPYWFYASPREGSQGLWQYCNGRCHKLEVEEDWFEVVRALLCITLIVYLAACVLALYSNCLLRYDPVTYKPSRSIEIVTAVAGLIGGSGMAVYTIMMKVQYKEYPKNYFGGAYVTTAASCGVALVAAVVMSATGATRTQNGAALVKSPGQTVVVTYQSTSTSATSPPAPHPASAATPSARAAPPLYPPIPYTPTPPPSYQTCQPAPVSAGLYPHSARPATTFAVTTHPFTAYPASTPAHTVTAYPSPYAQPHPAATHPSPTYTQSAAATHPSAPPPSA